MLDLNSSIVGYLLTARKFRHFLVVENGEVIALLDIAKCLYDAVARLERAAEKGKAIVDVVEGVENNCGASVSRTLTQVSLTSTINIVKVLFHVTDIPIIPKFKRKIEELEFKKKQQETKAIETSRKSIPSMEKCKKQLMIANSDLMEKMKTRVGVVGVVFPIFPCFVLCGCYPYLHVCIRVSLDISPAAPDLWHVVDLELDITLI
ncbi:hypothetical protein MTR67_002204 [Solanum verrucosum]|uniref:Uncharacterized protein n=1 Tax=Solanum verrucosum TaxID=315347 RepID=A0AAF0PPM8_SOLVR|nr:hypothetical protein MTR67_002204 [Solanum verrucosum]